MEETKKNVKQQKEPVYVERPDKTIVRTKHPRLEIKVLDADCTRKQLEHALRKQKEALPLRYMTGLVGAFNG